MARRLSFVRPKLRRQNVCEIEEEKEKGEENGGTSLLQSYNNASRARRYAVDWMKYCTLGTLKNT